MSNEMYNLISNNYIELFTNYCKYQNKYKLTNSNSCEDNFNQKILQFMELDIDNPTLPILAQFLKTRVKDFNRIYFIEYKENIEFNLETSNEFHKNKLLLQRIEHNQQPDLDLVFQEKLKMLFIDYRKPKKQPH